MSVQQVMQDIERAQLKSDASEETLKALEIDVTGKIMLASWRGTRFEVTRGPSPSRFDCKPEGLAYTHIL